MTTGLQAAHLGTVATLEAWRSQMSPREFAILLELLLAFLERELARPGYRRWAA